MKKYLAVFTILLLLVSVYSAKSEVILENINELWGMADSTDVVDGSISGADLADTLRHTGRIYTDVLDADTLYTSGVAANGDGLTLRSALNYLRMNSGTLEITGDVDLSTAASTLTVGGATWGKIENQTKLHLNYDNPTADVQVGAPGDSLDFILYGDIIIYGILELPLNASLPDTTGFDGGEIWLSETGDSTYYYLTDHTIETITNTEGLHAWAETDSANYNTAYVFAAGDSANLNNLRIWAETDSSNYNLAFVYPKDDSVKVNNLRIFAETDSSNYNDAWIRVAADSANWNLAFVYPKDDSVKVNNLRIFAEADSAKTNFLRIWAEEDSTKTNDLRIWAEDDSSHYNTTWVNNLQWDGGATNLVAGTGRTSLGLGTIATEDVGTLDLDNNLDIEDQAADNIVSITTTGAGANVSLSLDIKGTTGDGYVEIIDDVNSGHLAVGRTTATAPSLISITDGGADNEQGLLCYYDDDGGGHYTWVSSDHLFRGRTSVPTDDDADGYAIMDFDDGTIGALGQPVKASTVQITSVAIADDIPVDDNYTSTDAAYMTVGDAVILGDLLQMHTDGKLTKADADSLGTLPVLCVALETAAADDTCLVAFSGFIHDVSRYNWTVGAILYASTDTGEATESAPVGVEDQVQIVGVATHADRWRIMIDMTTTEVLE